MATSKFPEPEGYYPSPSADESGRFPIDALIRKHGYRIWERKDRQPPVWVDKNNIRYDEPDVLRRLPWEEVRSAEDAEIASFRRRSSP